MRDILKRFVRNVALWAIEEDLMVMMETVAPYLAAMDYRIALLEDLLKQNGVEFKKEDNTLLN